MMRIRRPRLAFGDAEFSSWSIRNSQPIAALSQPIKQRRSRYIDQTHRSGPGRCQSEAAIARDSRQRSGAMGSPRILSREPAEKNASIPRALLKGCRAPKPPYDIFPVPIQKRFVSHPTLNHKSIPTSKNILTPMRASGCATQNAARSPTEARPGRQSVRGAAGSAGRRTRGPSIRRRGGRMGASEPAGQEHAGGRRRRSCRGGLPNKARGIRRWRAAGGDPRPAWGATWSSKRRRCATLSGCRRRNQHRPPLPCGQDHSPSRQGPPQIRVAAAVPGVRPRTVRSASSLLRAAARWAARSATSSRFRFAGSIIASFTGTVMRQHGGAGLISIRYRSRSRSGETRTVTEHSARQAEARNSRSARAFLHRIGSLPYRTKLVPTPLIDPSEASRLRAVNRPLAILRRSFAFRIPVQ